MGFSRQTRMLPIAVAVTLLVAVADTAFAAPPLDSNNPAATIVDSDVRQEEALSSSEGGPPPAIENKVKQHKGDVAVLRQEIEANALLFNAIDSRRVLAEDVLAVDFANPGKIVIYAAAKPPK